MIHQWEDLRKEANWKSLLLGNGASIALHSGFKYESLYKVAMADNALPITAPLFARMNTNDFEYVLLACRHAEVVNSALGSPSPMIAAAYSEVRDALIGAVTKVHPLHANIRESLQRVGAFASTFDTVVTLNYDLTFYWAMMLFNEANGIWFKDAFIHEGAFEPDWSWLRNRYRNAKGSTMVFYAHGSLVLALDNYGCEEKLDVSGAGSQSVLLDAITNSWLARKFVPVFVSEGNASSKRVAINRSPYLSAVYNSVLPELCANGSNIVVYGFRFSPNDFHILDALKNNPPQRMAVSVYTEKSEHEQEAFCHSVLAVTKEHLPNTQVKFFDSRSSNCWNNPQSPRQQ